MSHQLPLAVSVPPQITLDDFIPGENRQLLALLAQLATGKNGETLFISGPPASGKTRLLMGLCGQAEQRERSCAYLPLETLSRLSPELLGGMEEMDIIAVDGIQHIAGNAAWEEALFVLFNLAHNRQKNLVFSADRGPAQLPLGLPDLRSRLSWGSAYRLQPLDDDGLMVLLQTQAQKRGLQLNTKVAQWLVTHCSRNPGDLMDLLEQLDQAALAEKRHRLTLPFIQASLQHPCT
ncbi:MAG TPA: DnaA regulatory inactivator Hda [Chromatiaceae bacterium]|nr:DnaA regulatory inactivator Hda [Chromatiaceae bacterium]